MNRKKLGWGIIATGRIAGIFAKGIAASKTGKLIAAASRSLNRAHEFAAQHSTPHDEVTPYGSYDELLADPAVDAVYIATPHSHHAQWAIAAARAGKHILCEKALAMNYAEAKSIFRAARDNDVFAMEAFMYRCHPQTQRLVSILRSGVIGEIKMIQSAFCFRSEADVKSRLVNPELGGGSILDVGCYSVSMSRLIAGIAIGEPFSNPLDVQGFAQLEEHTGIDSYAVANLKFPGHILAQVAAGIRVTQDNSLRIYGTKGWIHVLHPWVPSPNGGTTPIHLYHARKPEPEIIEIRVCEPIYAIEADTVAEHIVNRQSPAMSWEDSLGNMQALDQWRDAVGLQYPCDL